MYRIDVQYKINVQVEKFLKNIKRAGQNRRAGGNFFLKNIKRAERNRHAGGEFSGKPYIVCIPTWFVYLHGLYTYMVCTPTWFVYLHGLYTYMVCTPVVFGPFSTGILIGFG